MLAPGWGTGTRGGFPPGVKLGSLPVRGDEEIELEMEREERLPMGAPSDSTKLRARLDDVQKMPH